MRRLGDADALVNAGREGADHPLGDRVRHRQHLLVVFRRPATRQEVVERLLTKAQKLSF